MVFNTPEPEEHVFLLNQFFSFPTESGPRLAIALARGSATSLVAVYTLLVKATIVQLWTILVVISIFLSLRQRPHTHNEVAISAGLLNARTPAAVGLLAASYLHRLKRRSPLRLLFWLMASLLGMGATWVVPTLVAPHLVLGHGAPVNPGQVYVPPFKDLNNVDTIISHMLLVPSALRAAGSEQVANSTTRNRVQVNGPVLLKDLGDGELVQRYQYRYNVTAKDFGMQHYHGLTLFVEGSCITEYDWHNKTRDVEDGVDVYLPWKNKARPVRLSGREQDMPRAYFRLNDTSIEDDDLRMNSAFAIFISSVDRESYTPGYDPFFLTKENPSEPQKYTVRNKRPVLSCWQSDTWSYEGQSFSVTNLVQANSPRAKFPFALASTFVQFLSVPKIVELGLSLGTSALLSSSYANGNTFDAGSANISAELHRLVLAAYIATSNTLTDTTIMVNNTLPNRFNRSELGEVAGFVVYGSNVTALSISALVSIPAVFALMVLITYVITSRTWFPWYWVQALQATVLYSFLDERAFESASSASEDGEERSTTDAENGSNNRSHRWKRDRIAWFKGPQQEPSCITPSYDKANRDLKWSEMPSCDKANEVLEESGTEPGVKPGVTIKLLPLGTRQGNR